MSDPQDALKAWLVDRLRRRGAGSCAALARHLDMPRDAVTRMKNRDGAKEQRRIEAHLVPKIAEFFSEWPPGFDHMQDADNDAAALAARAKAQGGGDKRGKKTGTRAATKDVVVQGVQGPVTVIDKSVNVVGDENSTIAGHAATTPPPGAAELMGEVNLAIVEVYRAAKRKAPAFDELGRLAYERHAQILAACEAPDEFPHALEIMKLRLRRELDGGEDQPAN